MYEYGTRTRTGYRLYSYSIAAVSNTGSHDTHTVLPEYEYEYDTKHTPETHTSTGTYWYP